MFTISQVSPVHKKNDILVKGNYRLLSVLTSMSKIMERLMCDQIMNHFGDVLSELLIEKIIVA